MPESDPPYVEGEANFHVPATGKICKTWYKVYGDLKGSKHLPLVLLHGGPGFSHNYLLPLIDLTSKFGIPVVFYDQIGNGLSTHLPEKAGDEKFWTVQLFIDEFHNLLSHLGIQDKYDLLGHSWGAMLASEIAVRQPKGLHRLVLASGPASAETWREGMMKLRKQLPQDIQDILNKHEAEGTTDSEEYSKANDVCNSRFLCTIDPMPQDLADSFGWMEKEPSIYNTMWGHVESYPTGSLKTWSVIDRLHQINVPTLLTNGRIDEAQDVAIKPFFERIPRVKWVQFAESSHMAHMEERERYIVAVADFLA